MKQASGREGRYGRGKKRAEGTREMKRAQDGQVLG